MARAATSSQSPQMSVSKITATGAAARASPDATKARELATTTKALATNRRAPHSRLVATIWNPPLKKCFRFPQRVPIASTGGRSKAQATASIRSSATTAHFAVSSSTRITFTASPASRCSRLQQRWARSMRYIVAHMQTTGERKWISCSG